MKLENVEIGYGKKVVASGLTAELKAGELTCLVGTNGIGKSTLLRTIAGFQPLLGGQMLLDGEDMTQMSRHELSTRIAVVLTHRPNLQQMTVREVVSMGRSPYTDMWGTLKKDDKEIVMQSIKGVGIGALADRDFSTLSDGEAQKVMIAKALAQQTPIIILDEPTAFLDYPSKVEMLTLLSQLAHSGKAVLLSTHDLEVSLHIADSVWLMKPHTSIQTLKPSEIPADLMEIFNEHRDTEAQRSFK